MNGAPWRPLRRLAILASTKAGWPQILNTLASRPAHLSQESPARGVATPHTPGRNCDAATALSVRPLGTQRGLAVSITAPAKRGCSCTRAAARLGERSIRRERSSATAQWLAGAEVDQMRRQLLEIAHRADSSPPRRNPASVVSRRISPGLDVRERADPRSGGNRTTRPRDRRGAAQVTDDRDRRRAPTPGPRSGPTAGAPAQPRARRSVRYPSPSWRRRPLQNEVAGFPDRPSPQPTLELVCGPCGRLGRYDVERLAARHGNAKLSEVAADHRRLPQGKGVWRLIVRPAGRATGRMTAVGRRGLTLQIAPPFARTT